MATFESLITRVQQRLSMVAGTAVQVYAEDRIAEMLQHKFDILFDDYWWPEYNEWSTWTLDGSTGVVTTDLTNLVKRFEDIRTIYLGGTDSDIVPLPSDFNPNKLTGTTPVYYEPHSSASNVFKVWPIASTGTLDVNYRTKPATFSDSDEVRLDDQVLILGAAYDYLEDDGGNPGATQKMLNLFNQRLQQLKGLNNKKPIPLDRRHPRPESFTFVPLS